MGELLITTPYNALTVDSDMASKPNSLTTYFYNMSEGNLWLYGEEIAYEGPPINISTDKADWRNKNQSILQWYIDNHDLRSLDNNSDGWIDMIILACRARQKYPYSTTGHYTGVSDGDYLTQTSITMADASDPAEPDIFGQRGNLISTSGTYQTDIYSISSRYIICHELGHQLMNSGHFNGLHRWNLMSGAGASQPTRSGVVFSAYEKSRLNWIVLTDITDERIAYGLPDVTSSNDAVRIPVGSGNYFLLELRKNNTNFEITTEPKQQ